MCVIYNWFCKYVDGKIKDIKDIKDINIFIYLYISVFIMYSITILDQLTFQTGT